MSIPKFDPARAVEITKPKYGSAYCIGGRLVLTAAHLFNGIGSSCKVRANKTFGEVDAEVVWVGSEVDIALVELPETIEHYQSASFGRLPETNNGEKVPFQFYGWPDWACSRGAGKLKSGGRQIEGTIYLADTSPENLLVIEAERCPPELSSHKGSPWGGSSGAVIVCNGLMIAIQRQHQNPERPASLEAQLLSVVYADPEWRSLLKKNDIDLEFIEVQVDSVQSRKSKRVQSPIESKVISLPKLRSQMTEMLCGLDYEDQKFQFMKKLKSSEKAAAFVITAPCEHTRRWLVYRLIQEVPNAKNAIRLSFKPTSYFSEDDLWQHLAFGLSSQLKSEVLSDRHSVIQSLCNNTLSKPVIISIRDIDSTHERFERLIFDQFWTSLNQMFGEYECSRNRESRVVLFLTRDTSLPIPQDDNNNCLNPIYLSPLVSFSQDDIGEWLASFSGKTNRKNDQEALLTKLRASPPDLEGGPGAVMHQFCKAVGLQKGISELESMWGDAS
jgi:hypothetical protein